jgi:hypothetical protein
MNRSCFGVLSPTQIMSGLSSSMVRFNSWLPYVQRTERRSECADDPRAGKARFHFLFQRVCHTGRTTVEEMRVATLARELEHSRHQVRPIHAAHLPVAAQAPHPDHWHAIGSVEKRPIEDALELRIVLRLAHAVNTRDADVTLAFSQRCVPAIAVSRLSTLMPRPAR